MLVRSAASSRVPSAAKGVVMGVKRPVNRFMSGYGPAGALEKWGRESFSQTTPENDSRPHFSVGFSRTVQLYRRPPAPLNQQIGAEHGAEDHRGRRQQPGHVGKERQIRRVAQHG